jgi:hypothetical protein
MQLPRIMPSSGNLENLDTNRRDFHGVPLPAECRYRL